MSTTRKSTFAAGLLALGFALVSGPAAATSAASHLGVLATPAETTPVFRAQLEVKTCDVEDAGTDDDVSVRINGAHTTWLDYARDDFERNQTFTYDLGLGGVTTLGDLRMLRLYKTGDDGLCVQRLRLLINGAAIFDSAFAGGRWLDGSEAARTLNVSGVRLRASPTWTGYTSPRPPRVLTRAELESRIESMVGTMIQPNGLYWGQLYGPGVEVTRAESGDTLHTLHVDLDLAYSVDHWFDPGVDVDFDLVLCEGTRFQPHVAGLRVDVDTRWYSQVLSFGIVELVERWLGSDLEKIGSIQQQLSVPGGGRLPCPRVVNDGDIRLF